MFQAFSVRRCTALQSVITNVSVKVEQAPQKCLKLTIQAEAIGLAL